MNKQPLRPWELALAVGLIVGMLATPAQAEGTVLSRWPSQTITQPAEYQVTLFPFAVGRVERETLVPAPTKPPQTYQVKFKTVEWLEKLKDAIAP